ncbi:16749_t:CDS:2, partial [Gigaspora rosea]
MTSSATCNASLPATATLMTKHNYLTADINKIPLPRHQQRISPQTMLTQYQIFTSNDDTNGESSLPTTKSKDARINGTNYTQTIQFTICKEPHKIWNSLLMSSIAGGKILPVGATIIVGGTSP